MSIWRISNAITWMAMMIVLAMPSMGQNELSLNPEGSIFYRPGDQIIVDMDVADLQQLVNGCQAFIRYNSAHLSTPHSIVPGGGPWEELIYQHFDDVLGDLDAAIGVRLEAGNTGTDADGTVAVLAFTAGEEGITQLVFREDRLPDFGTMFSDLNACPVFPVKHDSPLIYIDATPPEVEITSVSQDGIELLSSTRNAIRGTVNITVAASDTISGLKDPPAVTVRPFGGTSSPAAFVEENPAGVFHYTYQVSGITPNGIATVSAAVADECDNIGIADQQIFRVNRNQVAVAVELDRLHPLSTISRQVVFCLSNSSDVVTETRLVPLVFTPGSSVAETLLTDVSPASMHISAKTNSHLRRRLDITFSPTGDFAASFTGPCKLLGGDLNGDNIVQMLDYSYLKARWYTSDEIADINGDGVAQMLDYSILQSNWFKRGDVQ